MQQNQTEKPAFHYKRKPAFISFLPAYLLCFGISYFLMDNSQLVSGEITTRIIMPLSVSRSNLLWDIPYGIIFSLPFLIYGTNKILWNIMSVYEIDSFELRLLTGSLIRKERFFAVSDFFEVSFRQNLIETPFRAGTLMLTSIKTGKKLTIKGVYSVKTVVEVLRSGMGPSFSK